MAFTWTWKPTGDDPENEESLNECKTNLDTIYSDLSLTCPGCGSGAGWDADWPIAAQEPANASLMTEMKDRCDYAYDNSCPTADTNDYTSYQNPENSAEDTTEETGYQNSHNNNQEINEDDSAFPSLQTYRNGDLGVEQSGENNSALGTNKNSACSGNDSGYWPLI